MQEITEKIKYFVYARKSSESEEKQIASIDSQLDELKLLAKKENLEIIHIFKEEKSAKAPGREIFNEMLRRIEAEEAKGIICWKIDRLARNPVDGGTIGWLLQRGVIKHIKTYGRDYYPGDNVLMMSLEFGVANQFILDLKDNTKRGLRKKVAKGMLPGRAPLGYYNDKYQEKGEKDIKPDPKNFEIIKKCWEEIIENKIGIDKLHSLAVNEWGLRTHWDTKPGKSTFHKTFRNSFYYGYFKYNSELHKGIHQPMITQGQFEEAQEVINRHGKPHPKRHIFAFTGLIRCGECGAMITAESKQKKLKNGSTNHYTYYRCTKRLGPCSQKCIEEKVLTKQIDEVLKTIEIPESFYHWALEILREENKNDGKIRIDRIELIQKEYKDTIKTISRLIDMRAGEEISAKEFSERKEPLTKESARLEELMRDNEQDNSQWLIKAEKLFNFAETAHLAFKDGDLATKRNILGNLGQNLILKDRSLVVDLKPPLQLVRTVAKRVSEIRTRLEPNNNQELHKVWSEIYSKDTKLGGYRELNPNKEFHKLLCCRYTIATINTDLRLAKYL